MRFIFLIFFFFVVSANADENSDLIRQSMEKANLGAKVDYIEPSEMPGLYVIGLEGGRVLYASEDGEFFIQGRLYKSEKGKTINLTERQERVGISKAIADIPESEVVVFKAKNETDIITVFTDTSCPFCHKLHEEIDEINDLGITVHYLAYPREGLNSPAYKTMTSVWCSTDRRSALSRAIDEEDIDTQSCDDPVKKHYLLGQQIGLRGTPTIVFSNGSMISGYRPPEVIKKIADAL